MIITGTVGRGALISKNIKSLADGQLAAAKATLYTVPVGRTTIITTISYVNADALARTINLYIKPSGSSSRRIIPENMILGASYMMVYDDEITLEAGDAIEGDASAAGVVDYTINGFEKT
jgi:hypothetical protein